MITPVAHKIKRPCNQINNYQLIAVFTYVAPSRQKLLPAVPNTSGMVKHSLHVVQKTQSVTPDQEKPKHGEHSVLQSAWCMERNSSLSDLLGHPIG